MATLTTQQGGKSGEPFVQHELRKHGVASAPMTTDRGIDLVALEPNGLRSVTIQVKTTRSLKSDDHYVEGVLWTMPGASAVDLVAPADLGRDGAWLTTLEGFMAHLTSVGTDGRVSWNVRTFPRTKRPNQRAGANCKSARAFPKQLTSFAEPAK